MKKLFLKWAVLAAVALPEISPAQTFNYQFGDVLASFRKTSPEGLYELVVDLGNVTNLIKLPVGTTINITNYTATQITNAFTDTGGFQNLHWSVFTAFPNSSSWVTPLGTFPANTLWFTLPSTNVGTQTQAPALNGKGEQQQVKNQMIGVGNGAASISTFLGAASTNNTPFLVREPVTYAAQDDTLSIFIQDTTLENGYSVGDFGGNGFPLPFVVENIAPNPFSAAQRSDFYESVPIGATDPIAGLAGSNAFFLGYFILNPNGNETFTRADAATTPAISSVTSSISNGFAPLQVVFTNTASGTITSWVWNFGNGTIITNATGNAVTNTYSTGGDFTVTLIVNGPGGSSTDVLANFIVASPTPTLAVANSSGGKFVLYGTNAPVGVRYRILTATNVTLALASWTPVFTNNFLSNGSFSYTNTAPTNGAAFFKLVSP
jgi:hypothetical protein